MTMTLTEHDSLIDTSNDKCRPSFCTCLDAFWHSEKWRWWRSHCVKNQKLQFDWVKWVFIKAAHIWPSQTIPKSHCAHLV